MSAPMVDVIKHYQRCIDNSQTDKTRLIHCINKLYKLPVNVEHLQMTGVGKTVNSLRKYDGEIGAAAKALVTKWKAMVAAEEEQVDTDENCGQEGRGNSNGESDSDGDGGDSRNQGFKEDKQIKNAEDAQSEMPNKCEDPDEKKPTDKEDKAQKFSTSDLPKCSHEDSVKSKLKSKHCNSNKDENPEKHHKSEERSQKAGHKKDKRERNASDGGEKEKKHKDHTSSSSRKNKHERKGHTDASSKERHHSRSSHCKNSDISDKLRKSSREDAKAEVDSSRDRNKKSVKEDVEDMKEKQRSSSRGVETSKRGKGHGASSSSVSAELLASEERSTQKRRPHTEQEPNGPKDSGHKKLRKNYENNGEGIDSSMGANFSDVLGMLNMPAKKSKKAHNTATPCVKTNSGHKENNSRSMDSGPQSSPMCFVETSPSGRNLNEKPDLLSPSIKLIPLDPNIALELPTISTNYRPMPLNPSVMDCVFPSPSSTSASTPKATGRLLNDDEALHHGISSKTIRTKIYSGVKSGHLAQVPTLFDLCIRVLQKNIDALEYTGGVPFEVLRPVLTRATPQQLLIFEEYNPYLMEETDLLWQQHVQRHYRAAKRKEMESWKEMFLRCQEDQERKLNSLAESIKQSQKVIAAPVRKTQLAFVDTMVKPPRGIQKKQEQYGTKSKLIATPAARVAALSNVTPNVAKPGDVRLRIATSMRDTAQVSNVIRPKKAPLMVKTLQFIRGRRKR